MNSLKITSATFVALFSAMSFSIAQEAITENPNPEKIILYNSQPVKVELEGDHIKSFVGEAPREYMVGYQLEKKKLAPIKSVATDKSIGNEEEVVNADYSILLDQKIHLNFKPGYATLDKALINKLDEVVRELKQDAKMRVLLVTYVSNNAVDKLSENRLKAATTYLKIKGVSLDRIQSENQEESNLSDLVAVNFLK